MTACMTHELVAVPECLLAIFTRVSFVITLMNSEMLSQMLTLGKGLVTHVTHVRAGHWFTIALRFGHYYASGR